MANFLTQVLLNGVVFGLAMSAMGSPQWADSWKKKNPVWRGVHLSAWSDQELRSLQSQIPALVKQGVNALVLEVDYSFQFKSRPEMYKANGISKEGARAFTKACHEVGVRVIPQVNCLGHQSWAENTAELLTVHPELDETPGQYPKNKDIYCRSWCPQHPDLEKIVYPMLDEIALAFDADGFHVGMDEVFLIGSDFCPRCKGKDRADLFANQVNSLHKHLTKGRHLELFIWADRFLDGKATGYGEWEASTNDTWKALDKVPKDIVLCDWHYEKRADYPSLKLFTDKGFRVWPSSWKDAKAAVAFGTQAKGMSHPKVLGQLVTTWGAVKTEALPTWPGFVDVMNLWK